MADFFVYYFSSATFTTGPHGVFRNKSYLFTFNQSVLVVSFSLWWGFEFGHLVPCVLEKNHQSSGNRCDDNPWLYPHREEEIKTNILWIRDEMRDFGKSKGVLTFIVESSQMVKFFD